MDADLPPSRPRSRLAGLALVLVLACGPSLAAGEATHRHTLAASSAQAPPRSATARHALIDAPLAADLLGWASRLSGLPSPAGEPPPALVPLPPAQLQATVCPRHPQDCASLVAVYDTDRRRVLYRDTLDMRDPTDQSFIVHELVHHLQFLQRGDALFASCPSTLAGEAQAYRAQNLYQAHFRQWQRMGEVLRFMHCDGSPGGEPVARLFGPPGAR
ncbi:DUF6647 family protein [Azohydromonas caseinilytica]|uniref:DUF6647 domain-containing protein n=1 Tax=Azohydromonas caseinilytica TaxID=2728836 RepID=A0A848FEE9_9BURK|nr:DUF6647 family protein [Azohydromonas caseinilytica]NML17672.1 hypothetical protein [Azohydromonas caseinilytica]